MLVINIRKKHYMMIIFVVLLFATAPLLYKIVLLKSNKEVPAPEAKHERPSPYGEFLSWDEANILFPKYARATVIDFETGLKFRVQRRAGKYHADVQPLTAEDTAIMKEIYNGKWSWKRKAIMVELDNGRRIAASMNGMPHGAGAIRNNNFNGHFCIHFRGSTTHGTRAISLDHQIMVWKAANRVNEQLLLLDPPNIIKVFFAAVNQGAIDIAEKAIDYEPKYATELLKGLPDIKSVWVNGVEMEEPDSFKVDVGVVYRDLDNQYVKSMLIKMSKSQNSGWKIDPQSLLPLLDKEVWLETSAPLNPAC